MNGSILKGRSAEAEANVDNVSISREWYDGIVAPHRYSISELEVIAKKTAGSKMFGSGEDSNVPMTEDQAFMMGLIAEAMNIPLALALLRFDIVKGKPAMKSAYVLAEFQQRGGSIEWVETTDEKVVAVLTCKRHPKPFEIAITLKELKDRKIAMNYNKEKREWYMKHNYVNHPRSMLRWRAVSEAVRAIDPGILMGMHTEIELEDSDIKTGPEPTATEQTAHQALRDRLKAAVGNRKEKFAPAAIEPTPEADLIVGDVVSSKPGESTPEPKSELRQWIDESVDGVNAELRGLTGSDLTKLVKITAYQVANAVLNEAVENWEGFRESDILNEAGKRDRQKAAAALNALWEEDAGWVQDAAGKYLAGKMQAALKDAPAATQHALPV